MNTKVLGAVFKRNFVSYLANPTGYVFVCVFVLLSTIAAFWPNEFFVTNLANLDQLNKMFPFIMLVFVPAVTMSVWADERRQGTDELLLTMPATDLDIVVGKYLAAVAIFSVSLLFSFLCNLSVLAFLGEPDVGLFLGTYIGYWLVGLAMLAVGMGASFLTGNLTVAYVLGAVFNLPLVFAVHSDVILGQQLALAVKQWSIGEQFADFGRGIISLSGLLYFGTIVAVLLYVSVILIARRHWVHGRQSRFMAAHYLVRTVSVAAIGIGAIVFFTHRDFRGDITQERLSSLSRATVQLLKNLQIERPVQIEAFISPTVPESYVQTRANLLSALRELDIRGGEKVTVRVNDTERYSEEAARAEQRYDITFREVTTMERGTFSRDTVFLGVAFTCGLEKVILPFVDRGIPVEYEMTRSIATVTQQKRRKVGVLNTDAQVYGQFNMQTMSPPSNWPIIDELEKQYEVEQVDASSPIGDEYDVLLAVQPSSLGPEQMDNFLAAIRSGTPTAIFEDPFPFFAGNVPGTSAPRRPPGGMNPMMMGRQPPPEKGNRAALWDLLQVDFGENQVIWQDYNPYRRYADWPMEFVFIGEGSGQDEPFSEEEVATSGLQHMLLPFPGSVRNLNVSRLKFTPLVQTGEQTGTVDSNDVVQMSMFGMGGGINPNRRQTPTNVPYVLAAHIRGKVASDAGDGNGDGNGNGDDEHDHADGEAHDHDHGDDESDSESTAGSPNSAVNVVLVADIDMLHREFFRLREMGEIPEAGVRFDFDNVTFVLNILDMLAGDDRFLEIRKRRPKHRTLTRIEKKTEKAREERGKEIEKLRDEYDEVKEAEDEKLEEEIRKMEERMKKEGRVSLFDIANRIGMAQRDGDRRKQIKLEQLEQKRDKEINRIETDLSLKIRALQDTYKMRAVLLPPIPPLCVAVIVFFTRRMREREGVSRSRLRS